MINLPFLQFKFNKFFQLIIMKQKKNLLRKNVFLFKRWENKGYSIFKSLGKIVIMLVLPLAYLTTFNNSALSQDTLNLQKIIVQSNKKPVLFNENFRLVKIITRAEIVSSTADNIADILRSSLGVDVRVRGVEDVQADISINGGTFDQVLILLNGIPMSDIQTGHNSLTLPVDLDDIQSIEILQGPGTRLYGLNAYSGAINFITKPLDKNSIAADFSAGDFGFKKLSFNSNFKIGKSTNSFSASSSKSSGYSENTDFSIDKIYYNSIVKFSKASIFFQTGIITKNFGAFNFYTPAFPFQYESINNEFVSAKISFGTKLKSNLNIFYHRNQDKFELFRQGKNWYQHIGNYFIKDNYDTAKYVQNLFIPSIYYRTHNYHLTNIFDANYNAAFSSKIGQTVLGLEFRLSSILSNILGHISDSVAVPFENNAWFTKYAQQNNFSIFINHSLSVQKFKFSAGASLNLNSMFGFYDAFGAELAYKYSYNFSMFSSVNQGLRMPTFTDLYYKGPSNIGNEKLKPEKCTSFEIGQKYVNHNFIFQSGIFFRHGINTIDWVKISKNYLWKPMNYTKLNTYGLNIGTKLLLSQISNKNIIKLIDINYSFLFQQKLKQKYISRYVLDYPANTFSFKLIMKPLRNLTLSGNALYLARKGNFLFPDKNGNLQEKPYSPFWLFDVSASYNFKFLTIYLKCSNILNTKYYDLSNVILPGRWIKGGINLKFQ